MIGIFIFISTAKRKFICTCVHTHIHTHNGISLSHKMNEIMSFATTWMHLGIIRISRVNQAEKDWHLYVQSEKIYTNEPIEK